MVRNKYIILPFLLLAWGVIFAHGIVPHHHHINHVSSECTSQTHQSSDHLCNEEEDHSIKECSQDCHDQACHFHVEILTQVSIDHVFISHTENSLFSDITSFEKKLVSYYQEFIPDQIPQKYYLRGPPQLHNS